MRGPAAPTSPGAWDARSEALLGAPAVDAEPTPPAIAPGPAGALPALGLPADPGTATPVPGASALDDLLSAFGPPRHPAADPGPPHAPEPESAHPDDPDDQEDQEPRADEPEAGPAVEAVSEAGSVSGSEAELAGAVEAAPVPDTSGSRPGTPPDASGAEEPVTPGAPAAGGEPAREAAPVPVAPPAPPSLPGGAVAPGPGAAWGEAPGGGGAADAGRPARRGGDPVKVLMHRHRELCARAVDPLEIAAGLEAQGFTDRTAARYRHRDVFSLAEELYARVPRGHLEPAPAEDAPAPRAPWALASLAPGAAAALLVPALLHLDGTARLAAGTAGALALAGALVLAVRRGPLRAPAPAPAARLWTLWLLAYAVAGDGLLEQVLAGGPDGAWTLDPAPLLGLALAVAPAAWCAHLFAGRARRRIAAGRGLADFAAATRAWLLAAVLLHLAALAALLALTGLTAGALALGALLLLARLLTVHGHPETAAAALAAACAAEALGLAGVLAARLPLPGFDALAVPVRTAVDAWGPGALPALVCGAAALGLLAHATGSLARASAHSAP
ncbi:hypothetical protein [Streptomyces omiyaensis]|uniref:hypothetical protein n=1 Tax=Streptomyces omiyaensis TaxID=68247 RepID=UPI0019A28BE9|nr:hypothetical protein [Streptomyces omiyaensis]GGY32478.1 hypothetical protein GCM10010363_11310 [Streptomyces omiyaensis]